MPSPPPDQAHGLRRLFAKTRVRLVPVVANPHLAFGGVLLERLCTALADQGARTLVVDASDTAPAPDELAVMGLAECIEPLSPEVFYLAAHKLPLRYVDTHGSTAPFLQAVLDAAPRCDVVLVHAGASELCRLFARQTLATHVRPMLLANDHPTSVTHAYAAMKLLSQRAQLMVFHLMLGAAPGSPRATRIAEQLANCADTFLGALLHDWALVDPASRAVEPAPADLRRLAHAMLLPVPGEGIASSTGHDGRGPGRPAFDALFVPHAARQGGRSAQALN